MADGGDGEITGLKQQGLGGDVIDVEGREQALAGDKVLQPRDKGLAFGQQVDQESGRGGLEPLGAEAAFLK